VERDPDAARLLIACPDRPGIVAAVAGALRDEGANITHSDQYSTDPEGGRFFMRVQFHLESLDAGFSERFAQRVAEPFAMSWSLSAVERAKRVALLVSRYDHCLVDLLWRWRRGELRAEIGGVVSNHEDLRPVVEGFGLEYAHVPVEPGRKPEAERAMLGILAGRFDLIVLARYMQILSGDFLGEVGAPVINIHHSFLPAFAGADPYRRAKERGVKLIGATAHYVTEELDAGPIIEQDVLRVTHEDSVEELTRTGEDVERLVLARAVKLHLEDRVLVDGSTTVVF
jgi:formyltetrahydrofolate deformylase